MRKPQFRVALVTAPGAKLAEKIARGLVSKRLAACVNVVPNLVSHYAWKGKLHRDREVLLLIKTRASLMPRLIAFVRGKHPAQVPEIISLPILEGDKDYLDWLRESLSRNA